MKAFVMDCSVTAGWVIGPQSDGYTMAVLDSLQKTKALVPGIWVYEVANLLVSAERRQTLRREDSTAFYKMLHGLSIEIVHRNDDPWSERLLWMAKMHRMTVYDAAYLHLAMDTGFPLATRDQALIREAKLAGVSIFRP